MKLRIAVSGDHLGWKGGGVAGGDVPVRVLHIETARWCAQDLDAAEYSRYIAKDLKKASAAFPCSNTHFHYVKTNWHSENVLKPI